MTPASELRIKHIKMSVTLDVLTLQIHVGDEYAAQVAFDDIAERIARGEDVTITMKK